jgi:hypothetical protein
VIRDAMGTLMSGCVLDIPKIKLIDATWGKRRHLRVLHRVLAFINEIVIEFLELDPFKNI